MYELCTIGHITLDKIQTPASVSYMPGGTGFYMCKALQKLNINHLLITAVAESEQYIVHALQKDGSNVMCLESEHTVYFENIYGDNPDHREQNVLHTATPFTIESMPVVDAVFFHLGPLLHGDISVELFKPLSLRGRVSLDVQGLLRYVSNRKVLYKNWEQKAALQYVNVLKANEFELEILTATTDVKEGARYLAGLGVEEVVITLGSKGSLILADGVFLHIPAFTPANTIDTTGCGDTYMAGYLYQRIRGANAYDAGLYGAAMATLKIESFGPFTETAAEIEKVIGTQS